MDYKKMWEDFKGFYKDKRSPRYDIWNWKNEYRIWEFAILGGSYDRNSRDTCQMVI